MNETDIEDPQSLRRYLTRNGRLSQDAPFEQRVLCGGVSNKTVWVGLPAGQQWVLKQALEKLRVQSDWFSSPLRIHREAAGMRALETLAPAGSITKFIFEDHQAHILAMSAVPQPHENLKTLFLEGRVEDHWIAQMAQILASIHRNSSLRLRELAVFADRSYFESLRLEPYYLHSVATEPRARAFLESLVAQTRTIGDALVHGDFSPKNFLVCENRLVLLDHEVIHLGDPAFDVGFLLTHLLSKAHHLPPHRDRFLTAARQFFAQYRAGLAGVSWLDGFEQRAVRHTLGCLLARVAGRSPLEYLDASEQARQREIALQGMDVVPESIDDLIGHVAGMLAQSGD